MQKAIVATGFPYDRVHNSSHYMKTFEAVLQSCGGVRRFGTAALDVCWIADNKFDAYFEFFIKPWDTLGASLILEEAGGKVIDQNEGFPSLDSNLIIASNNLIHQEFKEIVLSNIDESLDNRL
jgi:myo-inositol-1(or 4)-monophosphatase